jgi:creatinine amidohydrolase
VRQGTAATAGGEHEERQEGEEEARHGRGCCPACAGASNPLTLPRMQASPELALASLTSAAARSRLAANPVLLLPLGSLEDQGPATPMGDFMLAERVAGAIAAGVVAGGRDALVLPVLPFGGADYFGSVPGGIALEQATLRAVLRDVLGGLARHGLTRVMVVNGHGGNAGAIHDETLAHRRLTGAVVPSLAIWRLAAGFLAELVGAEEAARRSGHGADPLGSVAAHLLPELVRPAPAGAARGAPGTVLGLAVSGLGRARFDGGEVDLPLEFDGVAGGDPSACSAETGAALFERLVAYGTRVVLHLCAGGWGAI